MDPLSVTAAVGGFISLAIQISQITVGFLNEVKGFPNAYRKLITLVREFTIVVSGIEPIIARLATRDPDTLRFLPRSFASLTTRFHS